MGFFIAYICKCFQYHGGRTAAAGSKEGACVRIEPDDNNLIKDQMEANNYDIDELAQRVADHLAYMTKTVLNSSEAARYLGVSKSWLYKMTMGNKIPCYRPSGKLVYFNRLELEEWAQTNCAESTDI